MQRFGALEVAMRQNDLAFEVRNLGCGLDNTGRACDNGSCKIYARRGAGAKHPLRPERPRMV